MVRRRGNTRAPYDSRRNESNRLESKQQEQWRQLHALRCIMLLLLRIGAASKMEPIIKHSFVKVNQTIVHLKQYAANTQRDYLKSLNLAISSNSERKKSPSSHHLIIFVPGNPGAIGLYDDFLLSLWRRIKLDDSATILAISHNNFDSPNHVSYFAGEVGSIDEDELNFVERTLSKKYLHDPYHIELQVLNKLIILKRLISTLDESKTRITFVGHSIGCYVILRLLQDKQLAGLHANSILIHPALENLALTEKGQYFDRVFHLGLDVPMKLVAFLLDNLLPLPFKQFLTRRFCSPEFAASSSREVMDSMMQLACSTHLTALIRMAKSELRYVKQLDCEQLIKPHVPRIKFLYANVDHWVNASHRRSMEQLYRGDIHIEERDTMHAFVMDPKAVIEYADVAANFINQVSSPT